MMPNFRRTKCILLSLLTIVLSTNNAFGKNGFDLFSGIKSELAVDYVSPNGLLTVNRNYLNQKSGWVPNVTPRLLYIDAGQTVSSEGFYPQSRKHCLEFVKQRLVRYKDPFNEPNVTEVYYKLICTKYLNRLDEAVIYAWLNGKQHKFIEENGVYLPEGGTKRGLKIEAITGSTIPSAVWKMTQSSGALAFFDQTGQIIKTIVPSIGSIDYQFDNNQLLNKTDHSGRRVSFEYNDKGRLETAILPNGQSILYDYVDDENDESVNYWLMSEVTWPDGETLSYAYNEPANVIGTGKDTYLTGKWDAYNNRTDTYKYSSGKAISSEGFEGANKAEVSYRSSYNVNLKNSLGVQHSWYSGTKMEDGQYLITSKRQPAGAGSSQAYQTKTYNAEGQITQKINYDATKTQYAYDTVVKRTSVKVEGVPSNMWAIYTADGANLPAGATKTSTQWDAILRKPVRVATPNKLTTFVYQGLPDPFNNNELADCTNALLGDDPMPAICRIVEQATTDTNGQTGFNAVLDTNVAARHVRLAYDDTGKLLTVKRSPAFIDEVSFDYYQDVTTTHHIGDLKSVKNALGHQIQYLEYDANGSPTKIVDANGVQTLLAYDSRGRLISKSVANQTTTLAYDLNGNLTSITSPNGNLLTREYDGAGRLSGMVDGLLNRIELDYDLEGNLLSNKIINASAEVLLSKQNQYDALNRLQKAVQASGDDEDYLYDKVGNLTTITDAKENVTTQSFDSNHRVNKVTDTEGGIVNYSYDGQGAVSIVEDQTTLETQYQYNAFGQITQLTSPDTGVTSFTYDAAGNLLTKTDARNETVTFTYDTLNRPLTQSYSDAIENIVYSYDDTADGNKGIGRLTSVTDQSGSTNYFYNALGQVTKETRVVDGNTHVTEYHFDANGQMTGMTYPSGRQVDYTFDTLARISGMTSTYQAQTTALASNIEYLPFGPMKNVTFGNGKVLTQSFDLDYRLTDRATSGIHQMTYGYDAVNNINTITNGISSSQSQTFTYDKLSRLLTADGGYGNLEYTYDKVGNRLSKTDNTDVDTYTYEANSHRLTDIAGDNPISMTHDAIGNTLTKNGLTFTYNKHARLKSASKVGMNATYIYNYKGERVAKQVDGIATHFIYDLNGQLIAEADSTGDTIREYVYLNGQRHSVIEGSNTYYVHSDHLGTPIALTDGAGTVQWKAHYTPFGKAIVEVNSLSQNSRFPGQYFDSESGLHYNYFRDYDPEIGRYIQSDPIGLAGGINTYGYVGGNPVNWIDPYGLEAVVQACIKAGNKACKIAHKRCRAEMGMASLSTSSAFLCDIARNKAKKKVKEWCEENPEESEPPEEVTKVIPNPKDAI